MGVGRRDRGCGMELGWVMWDVGGKDGCVGWKCGMGGQKGMGCSGGARRVL